MKTRWEKIDFIYEKIANKDLTFWCRVIIETTWIKEWYIWIIYRYGTLVYDLSEDIEELDLLWHNECYLSSGRCIINDIDFSDFKYFDWVMSVWESEKEKDTTYLYRIIWHPVMIWDVIEYFYWDARCSDFVDVWKNLKAPIENQSDECIDFVYSLLEKENKL